MKFLIPRFVTMRFALGYTKQGKLDILCPMSEMTPAIKEYVVAFGTGTVFTWFNMFYIRKLKLDKPTVPQL